MPKRRTEDAVEVVMTDHRIQRRPPRHDLLAPLDAVESARKAKYSGAVELYYPPDAGQAASIYVAVAQLRDLTNLDAGIQMLEPLLRETAPARGEFFLDLAEACRLTGRAKEAIPYYEEAVRREPRLARAHGQLGETLLRLGRLPEAVTALERGLGSIRDPEILRPLGVVYGQLGRLEGSVLALTEAARQDPDHSGTWLNLAVSLEQRGDAKQAEEAYRAAIRVQPDYAPAHERLANLLDSLGDSAQARYHRERARRAAEKPAGQR